MFQINPKLDKQYCVKHMVTCMKNQRHGSNVFNLCSEYWEPLVPMDVSYLEIQDASILEI
jgi:hypothetical protein